MAAEVEHYAHALSGLTVSVALGTYAWHQPLPVLVTGAALAAGAAVLPDLDTEGSCVARSFGFLSEGLAWIVHRISGGHREYTHTGVGDVLSAALAAGAIAAEPGVERFRLHVLGHVVPVAFSPGRVILAAYLALLFGAGLSALNLIRRDHRREILAVIAAVVMAWTGWDTGGIAWAILIGTAVHALGDMLTKHGVAYGRPFTRHVFHALPERLRISTGHWGETKVVTPLLLVALGFLIWHDAGATAYATHLHTALARRQP
jgi:membrane-bound metal-dependent hydrolase YbcI (DUF457 family)